MTDKLPNGMPPYEYQTEESSMKTQSRSSTPPKQFRSLRERIQRQSRREAPEISDMVSDVNSNETAVKMAELDAIHDEWEALFKVNHMPVSDAQDGELLEIFKKQFASLEDNICDLNELLKMTMEIAHDALFRLKDVDAERAEHKALKGPKLKPVCFSPEINDTRANGNDEEKTSSCSSESPNAVFHSIFAGKFFFFKGLPHSINMNSLAARQLKQAVLSVVLEHCARSTWNQKTLKVPAKIIAELSTMVDECSGQIEKFDRYLLWCWFCEPFAEQGTWERALYSRITVGRGPRCAPARDFRLALRTVSRYADIWEQDKKLGQSPHLEDSSPEPTSDDLCDTEALFNQQREIEQSIKVLHSIRERHAAHLTYDPEARKLAESDNEVLADGDAALLKLRSKFDGLQDHLSSVARRVSRLGGELMMDSPAFDLQSAKSTMEVSF